MKIKIIVFIAACMLGKSIAWSQSITDTWSADRPVIIQPTPQSAIFEQYTKHEVSEVNGLPQISIPIYTIKIKGLEIPIVLNYHASGIKYRQYDGDVGAGWSLSAGGYRISRTINGVADELYPRTDSAEYERNIFVKDNNKEASSAYFMSLCGNRNALQKDSEFDIFTYMLPSTTGHFILARGSDLSKETVLLESKLDKITAGNRPEPASGRFGYSDWLVTDGSGFKYYMGSDTLAGINDYIEKHTDVKDYGNQSSERSVGWTLRKIVSPYNENVVFTYLKNRKSPDYIPSTMNISEMSALRYLTLESGDLNNFSVRRGNDVYIPSNNWMSFVAKIETDKEVILFTREGPFQLKKITIQDKSGNIIKTAILNYNESSNSTNNWHSLLTSVEVSGNLSSADTKCYNFKYFLPASGNRYDDYYPDYYGYYKYGSFSHGNPNGNIPPDNTFLNMELLSTNVIVDVAANRFVNWKPLSNDSDSKISQWYYRDRNLYDVPNLFTLQEITYPTGGRTVYEYEANRTGSTSYSGGLRIKQISSFAGTGATPDIVTRYKYQGGSSNIDVKLSPQHFIDQHYGATIFFESMVGKRIDIVINRNLQLLSNPVLPELADCKTSYAMVEITQRSGSNPADTLGRTVLRYDLKKEYNLSSYSKSWNFINQNVIDNLNLYDQFPHVYRTSCSPEFGNFYIQKYMYGYSPVMLTKKVYDRNNRLVQSDSCNYRNKKNFKDLMGFKVKRKIVFTNEPLIPIVTNVVYSQHDSSPYMIEAGYRQLVDKYTTEYKDNRSITRKESYTYNDLNQLVKMTTYNYAGDSLTKEYSYASDYYANIYTPIIRTTTTRNGKTIAWTDNNYSKRQGDDMYLLGNIATASGGSSIRTEMTFDKYDSRGNLLQCTGLDGFSVTYLWGYNQSYPIAEIKNATYDQIVGVLGSECVERMATAIVPMAGDMQQINNLRSNQAVLPNARITTFTYQPLVGMLSQTDHSGQTTWYSYDDMGRLAETYLMEGGKKKLLQFNKYNYKNQ